MSEGADTIASWRNAQLPSTVIAHLLRLPTALRAAADPGTGPLARPTAVRRRTEECGDRHTGRRCLAAPARDAPEREDQSPTVPANGGQLRHTLRKQQSKLAPTRNVATSSCAMPGMTDKEVQLSSIVS